MKYLDPKADLTFKKIFGNHPKRLISLLNALLPLSEEEQIHEIKYLPTELVPQLEGGKNTIVDVLCTDSRGRKFCVEMQMEWSDAFQQRVLFNDPEIGKAVEELEISGFTDAELRAYDKFWDSVSVERTLLDDRYQEGKEEGKHEANTETAQRLLAMGLSVEQVAKATQLPLEIIKNLSNS